MTAELSIHHVSGYNLYFHLRQGVSYVLTATGALEAYNAAHWADYAIAATEVGATGIYTASVPGGVVRGVYAVHAYERAGATAAITDSAIGDDVLSWSSTAELVADLDASTVASDLANGGRLDLLIDTIDANTAETLAVSGTLTPEERASVATAVWASTTRTLSSFGTLVASIWAAATRTLTGSALGLGPTASRSPTPIYFTVAIGGTRGIYFRQLDWSGEDLDPADVDSIAYTIYLLDDQNPPTRTAIAGHVDVDLTIADVLFAAVQSDQWASDWNFKHIVDVSETAAFAAEGLYVVEYAFVPTVGQVMITAPRVKAG